MKPALQIQNLSKMYRIGPRQEGQYRTLRETIMDAAAAPWRRLRRGILTGASRNGVHKTPSDTIWALKDVDLEIQPGAVVGIIGRNGAGKSTLLKILSRITEMSTGRVQIHGRVGSLLEVGTGFHQELTGRENIYLNGAILGMSRREIQRKFDEIVAFAEIGPLLDTPVKRYSSGMYVRLAFAVASHLEPEILLVDEVLAVGDLAFQKKCLGKMNEVTRTGRTILFVSHNTATILNLCKQVAVFERGRLSYFGECAKGVETYARSANTQVGAIVDLMQHPNRRGGSPHILQKIRLLDPVGVPVDQFRCGEPIRIELTVDPCGLLTDLHFGVEFEDSLGSRLFTVATHLSQSVLPPVDGRKRIICTVDELPLAPGRYAVSLLAGPLHQQRTDAIDQAAWFDVLETDFYGNGRLPQPNRGRFLMRSNWDMLSDDTP